MPSPSPQPGRLRTARHDAGRSLAVTAVAAGLDPSHYSRIERGLVVPSVATMLRIAQVLNLGDLAAALKPYVIDPAA